MIKLIRLFFVFIFAMLSLSFAYAEEGVVRIPLNTLTRPASDLRYKDKDLSFSDISSLFQQGFDLSTVSPSENKYWQDKKYPAVDIQLHEIMPQSDTGVEVDSYMGANRELGFYSVIIRDKQNKKYILTLGQQVHASLLRSALLRKIGYYQESPKYYSKIKINFNSEEEKNTFINTTFCENGPAEEAIDCLSISPFKTETNNKEYLSHAGKLSLYVHGIYLEKMNPEVPSLFDGLTPAGNSMVSFFSTSRAFRGLVVPFVIADLGESINRVSTQAVMIRNGWAFINYGFDHYFTEVGSDDVKWALRKVAQLNDQDWDEIVEAGKFPDSIRQLVKAKLLYRTKNFVDSFFDKKERSQLLKLNIPNINYTSSDGYVVKGKVVVENIPGYPQRFSNGDRSSPFESGDFLRYMKIKSLSSVIGVATTQLQSLIKTQPVITLNEQTKGVEVGPSGMRLIGSHTGMQLGLKFDAVRVLTTGTFYGSNAPIQLVDTVNISSGIGVMHTVNELRGLTVNAGANVNYNRSFTHVRPLSSIKESNRVKWTDLAVNIKLKKLGQLLDDGKIENKEGTNGFTSFMSELKVGEVFIISDSISLAGQAGVNVALDALMGFYSAGISPSVGFTAGGAKILMRQIQITKTDEGLQVFVRDQNTNAFSLAFDFNYFINLMKIKHETLLTDLHTDAFVLNYNGEFVSKGDKGEFDFSENEELEKAYNQQKMFGKKIAGALRALIFQSSTDQLYANFKYQKFSIDHMIKTKMLKTKILMYQATRLNEQQLLTIYKPVLNTPEGAQVVNEPIKIVSNRKGIMKGIDLLGFGLNTVDSVTGYFGKGYAPSLGQATQNPTQMPFGKARWTLVKTESEITQSRVGALPTVSMVQHVWGGWSIKRKNLDKILESVKQDIVGTEYDNQSLIPENVLHNVTKLDFFRVTSNLVILPNGIEKIKSLINQTNKTDLGLDKQIVWKLNRMKKRYMKGSLIERNKIITDAIFLIESKMTFSDLLKFIEKQNYMFYVQISGFRTGDENANDGDYISNILGEPVEDHPYANGLISAIQNKSKIITTELNRTQADFQ